MLMKYRPEIDGLRAVAVLPVILFHAGFPGFDGGFVGVDVFFVISGYLITSIILLELRAGTFSLSNFYERRARRILPALFLVILACTPFAWLWLPAADMKDFGESIIAVFLIVANIHFLNESGYFGTAIELKPLIHTWSLAVEEQFYLFLPALLLSLRTLGQTRLAGTLILLLLASLVWSQWQVLRSPDAAFYLLMSRAWELLLGALLALLLLRKERLASGMVAEVLAWCGLAGILAAVFTYDSTTLFPGLAALLPTLGSALIIGFAHSGTTLQRVLSMTPMVTTGLISYSAYLWHQPLFAFARHSNLNAPSTLQMLVLTCLTFSLAYISWYYVEVPVRRRKFPAMPTVGAAIMATVLLLAIGVHSIATEGYPQRQQAVELAYRAYLAPIDWEDSHPCALESRTLSDRIEDCRASLGDSVVVLVGDSHAGAIARFLREELAGKGVDLVSIVLDGCLPIVKTSRLPLPAFRHCFEANETSLELFAQLDPISVVYAVRWTIHIEGTRFDNREGGVESGGEVVTEITDITGQQVVGGDLPLHIARQLAALSERVPVVVMAQIPEAGWHVPTRIRALLERGVWEPEFGTSHEVYRERTIEVERLINALPAAIRIVRPDSLVCNVRNQGRCQNVMNGQSLYRDDDHPAPAYARLIARRLAGDALQ